MSDQADAGPRREVWLRGLIMLIFMVLLNIGQWLVNLMAVIQFLWMLFTGRPNEQLVGFGRSLAKWLDQVARFQACDSEERPFPWAGWPSGAEGLDQGAS